MIKRGRHKRNFTVIPNAIPNDDRISLEAKGLLIFLLSRPASWVIRHDYLQRRFGLSRQKLNRLLQELMVAGYVERRAQQPRDGKSKFGPYSYDVTDQPVSADGASPPPESRCRIPDIGNKKEGIKNSVNKLSPYPSRAAPAASRPQACQDKYTEFGRRALHAGMRPVFVGSAPYRAWESVRGPMGMPPFDEATIAGRRRQLVWLSSVYPRPLGSNVGGDDDED